MWQLYMGQGIPLRRQVMAPASMSSWWSAWVVGLVNCDWHQCFYKPPKDLSNYVQIYLLKWKESKVWPLSNVMIHEGFTQLFFQPIKCHVYYNNTTLFVNFHSILRINFQDLTAWYLGYFIVFKTSRNYHMSYTNWRSCLVAKVWIRTPIK